MTEHAPLIETDPHLAINEEIRETRACCAKLERRLASLVRALAANWRTAYQVEQAKLLDPEAWAE